MKTLFVLLLLSTSALTQNCPYLLKSLSKIDTNYNHKKGEPVRFRFNYDARWAMLESPTSEKQAEAFISDQSGAKLFLGARKETGGVGDLFGDNKKFLFTVDMQIKFDKKGNFTGVQQGDKLIKPADWNKQVESQFK
ncbi:MAG: hypothetical protein MUE30_19565 [Spirosomaceae bacterium]|nr:hypothetical protein [Spirosomataceae bacterium]